MSPEMLAYYEKITGRKYTPRRTPLTPAEFKQLVSGLKVESPSPLEKDKPISEAFSMRKIDNSFATIQHLNLTKQELKSDITTVRVEMKNLSKELKGEMADLRQELKTDMANLRQELKTDMANLRQELKTEMADLRQELRADMAKLQMTLTNAVELILQKMEETTAKIRVDIEEQRHHWNLAVDAYAPLHEKCEDFEVRLQKLEASR